jgi:hypothetical protein
MGQQQTKPRRRFLDASLGRFLAWLVNITLTAFVLVTAALGIYNVIGPGEEILDLAKSRACQDEPAGCSAMWTMWERRPWVQTLRMSTPGTAKQVECRREYIVYGPWSCLWSDDPRVNPASSPSAAGSPSPTPTPNEKQSPPVPTPKQPKSRSKPPGSIATPSAQTIPAALRLGSP